MIRRPTPADHAFLYWSTINSTIPVYHLPGTLRPEGTHDRPLCGTGENGDYSVPRRLPIKHAAKFARLCRRCSTIAGIDVRDQLPLWPIEVMIVDLEAPTPPKPHRYHVGDGIHIHEDGSVCSHEVPA